MPIFPPPLQKNDKIAVISPAGIAEPKNLQIGIEKLKSWGFQVCLGQHATGQWGHYSGTLEERQSDLNRAIRDPETRAIIASRGGFGCAQLLDGLDWKALHKHPKIIMGFSDLTALTLGIYQHSNLVTYHGPMVASNFGKLPDTFADNNFLEVVTQKHAEMTIDFGSLETVPSVLSEGLMEGELIGGCLSLLVTLMGTQYGFSLKDKILFWEDIREEPYRLDRMLTQLKMAAELRHVKGVLVGRLAFCEAETPAKSLTIEQILWEYFGKLGIPVVKDLPFGHHVPSITIPLGAKAQVDTKKGFLSYQIRSS